MEAAPNRNRRVLATRVEDGIEHVTEMDIKTRDGVSIKLVPVGKHLLLEPPPGKKGNKIFFRRDVNAFVCTHVPTRTFRGKTSIIGRRCKDEIKYTPDVRATTNIASLRAHARTHWTVDKSSKDEQAVKANGNVLSSFFKSKSSNTETEDDNKESPGHTRKIISGNSEGVSIENEAEEEEMIDNETSEASFIGANEAHQGKKTTSGDEELNRSTESSKQHDDNSRDASLMSIDG